MKVLAQRGKDILLVGDDLNGTGVVYNRALDDVTEPTLVQSILGRGYWTEPTLGTAQEQQAVRRVEREGKLQGVEFGLEFLRHGLGNGQFEHVLELGVGLGGHGDAKLVEGADQGAVRGEDVPGAFGPVGVVDIGVDVHGYVWHEHKAFDASQPRDDHGRWTEGGGGGTSDTAAPDKTMDAAAIKAEEDRASAALDKPNTAPNYFKGDISRDLAKRLAGNPAWKDYVARQQMALRPGETRDQHAASGMLSMWAGTAGDSNVLSVAMQKAINEEFNLKARTDHMPMNGPTVQKVYDDNGTAYRAFARAMYDNTQEELSKDGIKDLTLYRGVKFRDAAYAREAGFQTDAQPHEVTVSQQPASSWSYSFKTAYKFSGGAVIPGALMAATVPANRVLSTMKTGMGCKDEQEVIVLGSADDRVAAQGWGSAGNRYNVPSSPAALIHTKIRWLNLSEKHNPYHDELGRFTGEGYASSVSLFGKPKEGVVGQGADLPPEREKPVERGTGGAWPTSRAELDKQTIDWKGGSWGHRETRDGTPITPDTPLVVFHSTTREIADLLSKEGFDPAAKPTNLARMRYESGEEAEYAPGRGVSNGLYVAGIPEDSSGYGPVTIAVHVKASDIEVTPEQAALGSAAVPADPIEGLRVGDAQITRKISPEDIQIVNADRNVTTSMDTVAKALSAGAKVFDESQPRDEGGKWTSGGGGTATATKDINESLNGMNYPKVSTGEFLHDANERDRGGEGSAALVTPNGDLHDIKRAEHPNVKRRQVKDGVDKEEVDRQIEILATERETNVRIYAKPTYAQLDTLNDIHTLAPDRDLHYDMVTPTAAVSGKWGDNARGSSWDRLSAQLQQHYGVQLNKTARPAAEEKYREDQARDHGRFATEGGGESTVSVKDEDRAEIDRRVTQAVGHKLSDEQLAALVGAPEGSKISIVPNRSRYDPNTVVIMATHPDIEDQAVAMLRPEHQGQRMVTPYIGNTPATYEDITVPTELHYEQVFLTPEARGSGTGVKMLADSVEAAHQAGIDKVTMTAVGAGPKGRFPDHPGASGGENGYYVWPRLGFDGPVEKAGISAEPEKWPEPFKSATNVSDLLRLPGGAQHWKDYGDEIPLSMDTHPDSPGRQVMDAYVKQRGL